MLTVTFTHMHQQLYPGVGGALLHAFHFDPVQELGQKERALASWWALDMYSTVHYKVV